MIDKEYQEGVILNKYEGEISLIAGNAAQDGKIWMKWAFPQKRVDGQNVPNEKARPQGVMIGYGKDQAIKTLNYFLDILEGREVKVEDPRMPEPPEDNIPF